MKLLFLFLGLSCFADDTFNASSIDVTGPLTLNAGTANSIILPTVRGSAGQALITDAAGNMSWSPLDRSTEVTNIGLSDTGNLAQFADGTGKLIMDSGLHISNVVTMNPANAQIGTSYTLAASDCGNTVSLSNTSPITLNLATLPSGCFVNVTQANTGVVTVVNGGGLTRQNAFGLYRTRTQFSVISIQVDGTNAVISGDVN